MHIVIPAQNFARAKSRLSDVWSADQREYAACWMLQRVLGALNACQRSRSVYVLSDDAEVRAVASSHGAQGVSDRPDIQGHGAQLRAFADTLDDDEGLLVLMSDLPLVEADAMQNLLEACHKANVLLAPDRYRMGTNAAYFRTRECRDLHFGHHDSFVRHRNAHTQRARLLIHESPAFQFDLDSADDLVALQRWQRAHRPHDEELARCLWGSHA